MNISVIMPTYNRKNYLEDTINSVFNQSWNGGTLELIIVDDCSTDATEEYIHSLKNEQIRYIKNATNQGGAKSRNIGVENSSCEYIAFIDSDTIWYEDKLEKQIPLLIENPENIIYCMYKKQAKEEWILEPKFIKNGKIFNELLHQNFVDTPSAIMKKDIFLDIGGFDNRLPRFQDWDLFIRLSQKHEFICIEEPLFDSLTLEGSITANHRARLEALNIIFEKNKKHIISDQIILERFILKLINANLILNNFSQCLSINRKYKIKKYRKLMIYLLTALFFILPNNFYKKLYDLR